MDDRWMDGWMDGLIDRQGQMDVDEWMVGWKDGCVNGWIHQWMDRQCKQPYNLKTRYSQQIWILVLLVAMLLNKLQNLQCKESSQRQESSPCLLKKCYMNKG